jgi:5'-nucleotidase/UDP-sugar diphosphatase
LSVNPAGDTRPASTARPAAALSRSRSLDPARTYSLATNDFMARGGDDHVMFRDIEPVLPVADAGI